MLVLSRKKSESIIIDGKIEIKIIEAEDGRVRIGIEAPREIEIHRKEVFDIIKAENKAALNSVKKLPSLKEMKLQQVKEYKKSVNIKEKK